MEEDRNYSQAPRKETSERLAILEYELKSISPVYNKLSTALEKLTDVINSLKERMAVSDMKIETNDTSFKELSTALDKANSRISTLESWRWYTLGAVVTIVALIQIILGLIGKSPISLVASSTSLH